jgi:hypothetical protein
MRLHLVDCWGSGWGVTEKNFASLDEAKGRRSLKWRYEFTRVNNRL